MAALTLRNIPDDLYQSLKEKALNHHRSLNKEVVYLLEKVLQDDPGDDATWLLQARELRSSLAEMPPLDDSMLQQAKNEGRP